MQVMDMIMKYKLLIKNNLEIQYISYIVNNKINGYIKINKKNKKVVILNKFKWNCKTILLAKNYKSNKLLIPINIIKLLIPINIIKI